MPAAKCDLVPPTGKIKGPDRAGLGPEANREYAQIGWIYRKGFITLPPILLSDPMAPGLGALGKLLTL